MLRERKDARDLALKSAGSCKSHLSQMALTLVVFILASTNHHQFHLFDFHFYFSAMASRAVPTVVSDSVNAAGSLADMFGSATANDDAATPQHATTDDTTERSGTSLNVDQSSAQSRQQTEDGAAASASAQASSPPAPPARHSNSIIIIITIIIIIIIIIIICTVHA